MTDRPISDRPLTPADPVELHAALSHALRYDRSGRRTQDQATIMADVVGGDVSTMIMPQQRGQVE